MARRGSKSVRDLAKRRHVRSAQWRLPVGDAGVAALALSAERAAMLVQAVEIARDAETDEALREGKEAQLTLATERHTEALAALETASEVVTFNEIPSWVLARERLHADKDKPWDLWARLAAATWTDRRGVEHRASDLDGDIDDWSDLVEPLPQGDLDALASALTACIAR